LARIIEHSSYVGEHGEDMPEIQNWVWPAKNAASVDD